MSAVQTMLFSPGDTAPPSGNTAPLISGGASPALLEDASSLREKIRAIQDAGYIVWLDIRTWSGQQVLRPEDLGLREGELPELYSLGRKLLVPRETIRRFHTLADRARGILRTYGFPFRRDYFVPVTVLDRVFRELDEVIAEFDREVDRFLERYAAVWEAMEPRYREAARMAYAISRSDEPEEQFVERFLARVRDAYPHANKLRGKFSMSYTYGWPSVHEPSRTLPLEVAAELARRAREQLQRDVEAFLDQAARELRARVAEVCERVATMIRENQVIRQQTLESLRRMIQDFRALNFVDDSEVSAHLSQLEAYLDRPARDLNTRPEALSSLRRALDEVARLAQESDVSQVTGWLKRRIVID